MACTVVRMGASIEICRPTHLQSRIHEAICARDVDEPGVMSCLLIVAACHKTSGTPNHTIRQHSLAVSVCFPKFCNATCSARVRTGFDLDDDEELPVDFFLRLLSGLSPLDPASRDDELDQGHSETPRLSRPILKLWIHPKTRLCRRRRRR